MRKLFSFIIICMFISSCWSSSAEKNRSNSNNKIDSNMTNYKSLSEKEWKELLNDEEYRILREKGTERPWTGKYNSHFEKGKYVCAACGQFLFSSNTKFESHCGWPSFYEAENANAIEEHNDYSYGMYRIEVVCSNCGGHLGHVFEDGPKLTGLRYCINSLSLKFIKDDIEVPDDNDNNNK